MVTFKFFWSCTQKYISLIFDVKKSIFPNMKLRNQHGLGKNCLILFAPSKKTVLWTLFNCILSSDTDDKDQIHLIFH